MEITPVDVEAVLSSADNLNAALKTFLKREGRPGNSVEPFVKGLRNIVVRDRDGELLKYIQDNYAAKPHHFVLLVSYAFPKLRDAVGESVIEKYADSFNATFERTEAGIKILDSAKFKSIANEVAGVVEATINEAHIPCNNFSKKGLLATIFEPDVLLEVLPVLK